MQPNINSKALKGKLKFDNTINKPVDMGGNELISLNKQIPVPTLIPRLRCVHFINVTIILVYVGLSVMNR